jgi:NTP pyrophosphatase (non-canonical NTP hydrolase)
MVKTTFRALENRAFLDNLQWWLTPSGDSMSYDQKWDVFPVKIALIHSELSEALEAHRKNLQDDKLPHRHGIEVELADAVIRILDTAVHLGFDLESAIIEKLAYNRTRQDHKTENRAAAHGKKY